MIEPSNLGSQYIHTLPVTTESLKHRARKHLLGLEKHEQICCTDSTISINMYKWYHALRREAILEEKMAENFPELMKNMNLQIQKTIYWAVNF